MICNNLLSLTLWVTLGPFFAAFFASATPAAQRTATTARTARTLVLRDDIIINYLERAAGEVDTQGVPP